MSVNFGKCLLKLLTKLLKMEEKTRKEKETTPTQANSSFRRATTENNLKINNLIVKLLYPLQYLKEPKMS